MIDNSVTKFTIGNTNCIICGAKFAKDRASKLYCSKKCRQAAYYHRDKIEAIRNSEMKGINGQILTFSMREYKEYNKIRDRLINYRKLQLHFKNFEEGSKEWNLLYDNPNSALTFERYKIPKVLWDSKLPPLSIEQWSFIRSLYPELSMTDFSQMVCSLSDEFFNQISSNNKEDTANNIEKLQPIKFRYLHHLKKIVEGQIKFC
jgi:hypothetical protein